MLLFALACTSPSVVPDDSAEGVDSGPCTPTTWYADADADGVGGDLRQEACEAPFGHVAETGDCDDHDRSVRPGAEEVCDEADQDCDGTVDEGVQTLFWLDEDGDGWGGDSSVEACEAPFKHAERGGDCDDHSPLANPAAQEGCDGIDNDCDGQVDEGTTAVFTLDSDGDGHGDQDGSPLDACEAPEGYAPPTDCDDADPQVNPDQAELCSTGVDEDCDGLLDCEDGDCDGTDTCLEGNCTDGVDNELDGLTDCEDDECWLEPTCVDGLATVVTGGLYAGTFYAGGGLNSASFSASQLVGVVRLYGDFGSASCSWVHTGSVFGIATSASTFSFSSTGNLVTGSGCPLQAVPWPGSLHIGSSGSVRHSQGAFLRPASTAWRYTYVGSSSLYASIFGSLTSGDPYAP